MENWIGVDLDGTLAHYDGWDGWNVIGPPIPLMLERVKLWLDQGKDVRIITAHMIEQWDDRAVQVVSNTGRTLADEHAAELSALRGRP
jgi:hypothetical protein